MIRPKHIHTTASSRLVVLVVLAGLLVFMPGGGLVAQSAEGLDKNEVGESAEASIKPVKEDKSPAQPVDILPSKFAGKDARAYVKARAAIFSMRNRPTDPFGLFQDPDMKPIVRKPVVSAPNKRLAALPPTPLADIVGRIRVTTIMPGEKKFLVGTRSFSEGDEFALSFQGKTMRMKVLEVTPNRILFRDLDKGEEAALQTGLLPPGMVISSGKDLRPPGMVSPVEELPLTVDAGDFQTQTE